MSQLQRYVGPSARYFEDFKLGERIVSQGRTITQADGLLWAMYTGDMNPMHVDHEFAAKHALYGGAFPPGLMAVAIAQGLKERLGWRPAPAWRSWSTPSATRRRCCSATRSILSWWSPDSSATPRNHAARCTTATRC